MINDLFARVKKGGGGEKQTLSAAIGSKNKRTFSATFALILVIYVGMKGEIMRIVANWQNRSRVTH